MTIVAGFLCPDGFVISADTEVAYSSVRYQITKLVTTARKGEEPPYWLVLGGAGNGDYLDSLMQRIASEAHGLPDPSVDAIDTLIRTAVNELHDQTLFPFWQSCPDERHDYRVGIIAGLRDPTNKVAMWRTIDKAVTRYDQNVSLFLGTGDTVAQYVSETLFQPGLPVAVVHELATQILMEARTKGENVGGNIDTSSARVIKDGYRGYFSVREADQYLWGLEDALNSAVRCALNDRPNAMMLRVAQIVTTLQEMQKTVHEAAAKPSDTEWHTMRVFLKHTHPFRDY